MRAARKTLIAAAVLAVPMLLGAVRAAAEDSAAGEGKAEEPPPFDAQPFSEERTPLPTRAEWASAPRVTLDPRTKEPGCSAWRVREWVRLRCDQGGYGAVRMLAGERDGLQMRLGGPTSEFDEAAGDLEVVLPVRRGDARVIELMSLEFGYKGSMSVEPWRVLSEVWPAEDERPTIVLQ